MNKSSILALPAALLLAGSITACSGNDTKKAEDAAGSAASNATSAAGNAASGASSAAGDATSKAGDATSKAAKGEQADPFTMPNEVGKKLQEAQDDIQKVSGNPLYISHSDDALGKGRHQLVDSNWKVCSQTPTAGSEVKDGADVRFATVKLDETCP